MGNQRFESSGNSIAGLASKIVLGIGALVAFSVIYGCFYTVDQSERAIILRNGAYANTELPGLHWKVPMIDTVVKLDTQTHKREWGTKKDDFEAYSADQQPAHLRVSVNFRVAGDKVNSFYERFRGDFEAAVTRLISPHVNEKVKNVFGQYTAARSITERTKLNSDATEALKAAIAYDPVFVIESVQIEDISFSDGYKRSIEERMTAEIDVAKLRQNLDREKIQATIAVTQAQGRADAQVAEATARAKATILAGDAEAQAIKAKGDALAQNPALVNLVQAEKWNGALPTTMVPGSALPMITLPTTTTTTAALPAK